MANTTTRTTTQVQAMRHNDVRGKELYYLIIGEGENEVIINVGLKTLTAIEKMVNEKTDKKVKAA